MFRNLRFYRITNPWPKNEQKLSEVLSENAFSPCGAFSERSAGWEAPAIYDDAPLCRRLHGANLLQLRTQSRVLPVAAIKEALEEKCIGIIDRLFRRSQQPAMTQFPHHSQTRPWTERVTNWF
jgi:recombination associated protein RdgC